MREVEAVIRGESILVTIPAEFLKTAFQMGVTTNATAEVGNVSDMLMHFCREFESGDSDSIFGRFVDNVCEEAINQGESFLNIKDKD